MRSSPSTTGRHFLSCDWGTSTFRLRLVDAPTRKVVAESHGPEGISATYSDWRAAGEKTADRWSHFRRIIERHLEQLARQQGDAIGGAPLLISGMASSSIGMRELPYASLPLAVDGTNLQLERVDPSPEFHHPLVLISGVRSETDIMRGEETQLVGACAGRTGHGIASEQTLIFPGTHSKHVHVRGAEAVRFETYMTGEFFELLSRKSVLAHSVTPATRPPESAAHSDINSAENLGAFETGVQAGAKQNLLHAAFRVRTRAVLSNVPPAENLHYLSGLLIGAELREVAHGVPLTLVGSGPLLAAYRQAFRILAATSDVRVRDADECLIGGQITIANRLGILDQKPQMR